MNLYLIALCFALLAACEKTREVDVPKLVEPTLEEDAIRRIESGTKHTCANLNGGRVVCWGGTASYQLGLDENGKRIESSVPHVIVGIDDAVDIAAGAFHTCAIRATGRVSCWGEDGANEGFWEIAVEKADQIVAAEGTTCVNSADGIVCWGKNTNGQIPTTSESRVKVPTAIGIKNAQTLIGAGRTFAVKTPEGWLAWGDNSNNALLRDSPSQRSPVAPFDPPATTALSFGERFACASTEGTTMCWGELGKKKGDPSLDPTTTEETTARAVPGLKASTQIVTGPDHGCAISEGAVSCWGRNSQGALGDGTSEARPNAEPIETLKEIAEISAGQQFTCATDRKKVWCWGNNDFGQIGVKGRASQLEPIEVALPLR